MYSCSKFLAHPLPSDGLAGLCLVSSLSHSWGNFKFFSLSFLRYFGLIISFIWLIKYFIYFCLCSDIYPILAIFLILWWEISSFLVYQSYFHGMSNYKKVFYFNNNKSTRKNCSKYKQPFKSISWSGSGRILSGRSKYNSDGSIFY